MKKSLAFITAAVIAFAGTACAEKGSGESLREPVIDEYGKHVITVGLLGGYMTSAFSDQFFPDDISVEFKYYSKLAEDDDQYATKAMALLRGDLISGQAPDIIMLAPSCMANLIHLGVMADMYPLMDACEDGIHREDFLPNVLEGFDVDGELPALANLWFINTAAVKTKFLGKEFENWTPEQAMQAFADMPEGMKFCQCTDEYSLMQYMTRQVQHGCVDPVRNVCNFTGSDFEELLRFSAENNPDEFERESWEAASDEEAMALEMDAAYAGLNDTYLVNMIRIAGFNDSLAHGTFAFFGGEDITFVGYPSSDGCGAYTTVNEMYGISRDCPDKETAWRVVSFLTNYRKVEDKFVHADTGLNVTKAHLERDFNRSADYGSSINRTVGVWTDQNVVITEEYKQMLYDYILRIKFDPYTDYRIENMIDEETAYVVSGEHSPGQCADILQGRVEIYLSERE